MARAGDIVGRWIAFVHAHAVAVLIAATVTTALSLVYVAFYLGISTSTTDMIAADVPFRQHRTAFNEAFPQFDDNIVVVIDADTPEAAQIAADRLAETLSDQPALFRGITRPGAERFFRENGLLFLDTDELIELADRLAGAEPLLGALSSDPTLHGLIDLLGAAMTSDQASDSAELNRAVEEMAVVAEAMAEGRPKALSWTNLINAQQDGPEEKQVVEADFTDRQFVIVQPVLEFGSLKPAAEALAAIRDAGETLDITAEAGLRLRITGSPAIEQEELESVALGGQVAGYLSLALVTILLVAGLKSIRLAAFTVITLLMGLAWTSALATFLVGELNLISVAFAVLFIGLGVDFGIHFTLRYLETGVADRAGPQALVSAGAAVGGALTLSAVCAAAGFFAFLPTDYVGLAELGLIAGIGMFVALTANLTVLPACLAVAPPRAVLNSAVTDRRAQSVAAALQRHAKSVLAAAGLAAVASFALVPSIEFDFNPLNLRDPGTESVATFLDLARDPNSSFYAIDLLVDNVDAIGAVSRDLADLDQVSDVVSVLSFVPDNQDEKLEIIDELAFFLAGLAAPRVAQPTNAPAVAPPAADEVGAQLAEFQRLLAERAIAQDGLGQAAGRLATALDALGGPDAQLTRDQIVDFEHRLLIYLPHLLDRLDAALYAGPVALETLPAQITEQWVAADGRARLLVQPASGITTNAELARFADTVATVAPRATGTPVIVTEAGRVILNAFMTATAIACIAILIILFATVRRPADIGLILVPLIFAAALTIAASVALGLAFNFANIIVLPLLLGLGIASAIHFVLRWRAGGGDMTVVASSTPRAVFFSAMTTVAAFGSLALSSHLGMRSMGLLLAIALTATLISTLIVLPSLMVLVGGNADRKKVVGGSARR